MTNQSTKRTPGTLLLRLALATTLTLTASSCHWITLVSQSTEGTQGNDDSASPALSADGRYVAFASNASNLVADDTNEVADVFRRDNQTGIVTRVSIDSAGNEGNGLSRSPAVSADGRHIAFSSTASNLVSNDTNNEEDIFVHDTQSGITSLVSVNFEGTNGDLSNSQSPVISNDGRYVGFISFPMTGLGHQSFVRDMQTKTTIQIRGASEGCFITAISGDGRHVLFDSGGPRLVPGDNNNRYDVFIYDIQTGTTTRVSVDSSGDEGNDDSYADDMSNDGRFVTFSSEADNLVLDDTNNDTDVFLHDTQTGITKRVSVDSSGNEVNGHRWGSSDSSLSNDGRHIVFRSYAPNLVLNDTNDQDDIFLHDSQTGITTRVNIDTLGNESKSDANSSPILTHDGRYVAFSSNANDLVAGITGDYLNIFMRAVPVIEIDFLSPDHLPIGATTSVTINGSGFLSDVAPWFNHGQLTNVIIVDENTITADFTIPSDSTSGAYTMGINWMGNVSGPGNATGVAAKCADCVTLF